MFFFKWHSFGTKNFLAIANILKSDKEEFRALREVNFPAADMVSCTSFGPVFLQQYEWCAFALSNPAGSLACWCRKCGEKHARDGALNNARCPFSCHSVAQPVRDGQTLTLFPPPNQVGLSAMGTRGAGGNCSRKEVLQELESNIDSDLRRRNERQSGYISGDNYLRDARGIEFVVEGRETLPEVVQARVNSMEDQMYSGFLSDLNLAWVSVDDTICLWLPSPQDGPVCVFSCVRTVSTSVYVRT